MRYIGCLIQLTDEHISEFWLRCLKHKKQMQERFKMKVEVKLKKGIAHFYIDWKD